MSDEHIRKEVLGTAKSFCITAPAGSGKTSLLTQRILALLPTVERPEQVLAITFTRKASAEMRSRVVEALQLAREAIVPSVNVTWSGLPVFFPKMGLPHVGQNTFVTTDCWADVYSISRMAPETVTASAANIAPTESPAPLSLRHSLQ